MFYILLSPAKKLNEKAVEKPIPGSYPEFQDKTASLLDLLCSFSPEELRQRLPLSDKLIQLNHQRYANWHNQPEYPAGFLFAGDVYASLEVSSLGLEDLRFAQKHLRILSGLYGLLRPMDLIKPYRLEMGTDMQSQKVGALVDFWQESLTDYLNHKFDKQELAIIINLASNEYASSINWSRIKAQKLQVNFYTLKEGKKANIGILAKRARGALARHICEAQSIAEEVFAGFDYNGYKLDTAHSTANTFEYVREG